MRILIMFLLRFLFMPFALTMMLLTASIEYMSANPDWDCWRNFNDPLIGSLPWSKYK